MPLECPSATKIITYHTFTFTYSYDSVLLQLEKRRVSGFTSGEITATTVIDGLMRKEIHTHMEDCRSYSNIQQQQHQSTGVANDLRIKGQGEAKCTTDQ